MAQARRQATEPAAGGTPEAIRAAAVSLFATRGYEATTMRELARAVGVEAASIYNHFPSKHVLLADLLVSAMAGLVESVREAVDSAPDDPVEQMRVAVEAYVLCHRDRLGEASITDTERRSLLPEDSARLLALREELAELFRDTIRRGVADGSFVVDDIGVATLSILSICARLPVWYRPDGRMTLDKIADILVRFVLRGLGVDE